MGGQGFTLSPGAREALSFGRQLYVSLPTRYLNILMGLLFFFCNIQYIFLTAPPEWDFIWSPTLSFQFPYHFIASLFTH